MAAQARDVELIWLPNGTKATGADFSAGEQWPRFDDAIVHAGETVRRDGKRPWIRCDKKFVLSPDESSPPTPASRAGRGPPGKRTTTPDQDCYLLFRKSVDNGLGLGPS